FNQFLHRRAVRLHVWRDKMRLQRIHILPLFHDRDDIPARPRQPGNARIHIDCRPILDTAHLGPHERHDAAKLRQKLLTATWRRTHDSKYMNHNVPCKTDHDNQPRSGWKGKAIKHNLPPSLLTMYARLL